MTATAPATILVVEDEPAVLRFVSHVLSGRGYATRGTATAEEALDAIRAEPRGFDLLVTDLNLEKMGGASLARVARRASPAIGVLFLTGDHGLAGAELERQGLVLTKPFTPTDLLDAVARALVARAPGPASRPNNK